MKMCTVFALILCLNLKFAIGYNKFASPLEDVQEYKVYTYHLVVQWKLSMAHYDLKNKAHMLQWEPDKNNFVKLDGRGHGDEASICNHTTPLKQSKHRVTSQKRQ